MAVKHVSLEKDGWVDRRRRGGMVPDANAEGVLDYPAFSFFFLLLSVLLIAWRV